MQILTHRANTPAAFRRSLLAGFGAELDIRDRGRALVVAHGLPSGRQAGLGAFLKIYSSLKSRLPLALNIKSCGLQDKLAALLKKYKVRNYFVFDMAVPDGVEYSMRGIRMFTRESEYERPPSYYDRSAGVWLDEFHKRWIDLPSIKRHLENGKQVCVVSPELHKRGREKEWAGLKKIENKVGRDRIMLCTDHPQKAAEYFNGRD